MSSNSIDNLNKPALAVTEVDLDTAGYTASGKAKFKETIQDFANQVFVKAVRYGDAEKGTGLQREITHDHVTSASSNITKVFGRKEKSKWIIAAQVAEYIFTGIAGVGGGNLKEQWGIATFGIAMAVAVVLIVARLTNSSKD